MTTIVEEGQYQHARYILEERLSQGDDSHSLEPLFGNLINTATTDEERSSALYLWGSALARESRWAEAESKFMASAELTDRDYVRGKCLTNIARLKYFAGDAQMALAYAQEAEHLLRNFPGSQELATAHWLHAESQWQIDNPGSELERLRRYASLLSFDLRLR